MMGGRMWG